MHKLNPHDILPTWQIKKLRHRDTEQPIASQLLPHKSECYHLSKYPSLPLISSLRLEDSVDLYLMIKASLWMNHHYKPWSSLKTGLQPDRVPWKLTVHLKPQSAMMARTSQLNANEISGTSWDLWACGQVYSTHSTVPEGQWRMNDSGISPQLEPYASELCAWYMHSSTTARDNIVKSLQQFPPNLRKRFEPSKQPNSILSEWETEKQSRKKRQWAPARSHLIWN